MMKPEWETEMDADADFFLSTGVIEKRNNT